MNKQFAIIIFTIGLCHLAYADTPAQQQCKSIHHVDIEPSGTQYLNYNCLLNCNVHGVIYSHNVNEGQYCMANGYTCQQGRCLPQYQTKVGHIDIEIESASVYETVNGYATVCLMNSSEAVPIPIQDRSKCISCSTQVRQNTNYPVWNEICKGSGNYLFIDRSRITIEIWNHLGTSNNKFIGGTSLTIDQLVNNGDNNKEIRLALTGYQYPGQVTTRITWTPRN